MKVDHVHLVDVFKPYPCILSEGVSYCCRLGRTQYAQAENVCLGVSTQGEAYADRSLWNISISTNICIQSFTPCIYASSNSYRSFSVSRS